MFCGPLPLGALRGSANLCRLRVGLPGRGARAATVTCMLGVVLRRPTFFCGGFFCGGFFLGAFSDGLVRCLAAVFVPGLVFLLAGVSDFVFALMGVFRFLAGFAARLEEDFFVTFFLFFFMLALRAFFICAQRRLKANERRAFGQAFRKPGLTFPVPSNCLQIAIRSLATLDIRLRIGSV